jgi:hypothetical protein
LLKSFVKEVLSNHLVPSAILPREAGDFLLEIRYKIDHVPSAGWRIREIPDCASSPKTHPQTVRLPKTSRKWPSKTQHNRRFSAQKSTWQW